jgi:hypothetical protein
MGYRHISAINKSDRARRRRQEVGGKKVPRYAWSPYTAIPGIQYDWHADVTLKESISSPPGSESKIRNMTVYLVTGNFLQFRDFVKSGEVYERVREVVEARGGELYSIDGYWRNS